MFGVAARASSLARMEPLTDLGCRLLSLLMQQNRSVPQCTTDALARDAHVPAAVVRRVLTGLERRDPPLVHRPGPDATTGEHFWQTTYDAAEVWEANCGS
jgi:hypothetical protein